MLSRVADLADRAGSTRPPTCTRPSHGYDLVLVSDGHSTFGIIQYAGRSMAVTPAAEVTFA